MSPTPAELRRLLQVVADYKRPSAVQTAGCAGRGRASRPHSPGVSSGRLRAHSGSAATLPEPSLTGCCGLFRSVLLFEAHGPVHVLDHAAHD